GFLNDWTYYTMTYSSGALLLARPTGCDYFGVPAKPYLIQAPQLAYAVLLFLLIHDTRRILPGQSRSKRLQLLLCVPVLATGKAERHYSAIRFLPRGGRCRGRNIRALGGAHEAGMVAQPDRGPV